MRGRTGCGHTLHALRSSEATGRDSDHPWTVEEIVTFRWNKMYSAGSGMVGRLSALAHVVNPAFHADASVRDTTVLRNAYEVVKYRRRAVFAMKVWGQLKEHLDVSKTSEIFIDRDTSGTALATTSTRRPEALRGATFGTSCRRRTASTGPSSGPSR